MPKKKTTIQDIANSLGFSRVTVSKALRNSADVSEKTKEIVLNRAKLMGYKTFQSDPLPDAFPSESAASINKSIALFLHMIPDSFHMASYFVMSLEQALGKIGYSLSLHLITDYELSNQLLPASFHIQNTDAILALEIFNRNYCEFLCTLGKPILFSDIYSTFTQGDLSADILVADNYTASVKLYSSVIEDCKPKSIGFLGDPDYSLSFQDRFKGFLSVTQKYGFSDSYKNHSIISNIQNFQNDIWMQNKFKTLEIPNLLVCANDILAMKALTCLERLNIKVPDEVMVCGYDGTPAISSLYPALTTIIAPSEEMGIMAAEIISHKIKNPQLPNMIITMNSKIKKNRTTGNFEQQTIRE